MTKVQLPSWVRRNPVAIAAGAMSLVLAVTIFLRADALAQANATLDEKSTQARRYDLNLTNATQLKEQAEALSAANREIQSRLIRAAQLGINQQYFYKLESEYGVKLSELRQQPRTQPSGAFVSVGFSVNVQGDFPSVVAFLRGLEQGAHYCRIISATCTGDRTGPVSLVVNLELLGQP